MVGKTVAVVALNYRDYFPPSFHSDFLSGREAYFFGWYRWAFYVHILAGPVTLLLGPVLLSATFRRKYPAWHRSLGKLQVSLVLLLVAPSGLAMAWHAQTGTSAAVSFGLLSIVTTVAVTCGWRAAVARRFGVHRAWMLRTYVLLCSAILLRVLGGLTEVLQLGETYPLTSWASWLLPLVVFELWQLASRRNLPATLRQRS